MVVDNGVPEEKGKDVRVLSMCVGNETGGCITSAGKGDSVWGSWGLEKRKKRRRVV